MSGTDARVGWRTIFAFGTPAVGAGYMYLLMSLYTMKFATDVLLIAPAAMGLIFSASRLWDAVSDPLAGYFSDRTRSPLGRRRPWILASILPIGVFFIMVFSVPRDLGATQMILWMTVAVIGFYSAMTIFLVPHMSLGAELTDDYHERTRLFGMRHAFYTLGYVICIFCMQPLIVAKQQGPAAARDAAELQSWIAVGVTVVLMGWAVVFLRERARPALLTSRQPFAAYTDVLKNPYARRLYLIWFIENIGTAVIGALTLYIGQYVVGAPSWSPVIILTYLLPSSLAVPVWLWLSRRLGKVRAWTIGMVGTGLSFGGMFALGYLDTVEARLVAIFLLAFAAGFSSASGGSIGPSVQGDVIDYDELMTGERKEGSYYAAWNFVHKSATGVMLLITGFALEASGFVPNAEQSDAVKFTMLTLYALCPFFCYAVGAWMFRNFALDESAHARIQEQLAAKGRG